MAQPPVMRPLRQESLGSTGEDVPEWAAQAFSAINQTLNETVQALQKRLNRTDNFESGVSVAAEFTTDSLAGGGVALRNTLSRNPSHLSVTRLVRRDGTAITSAFSNTWTMRNDGLIIVSFQGLAASTAYSCNVVYE